MSLMTEAEALSKWCPFSRMLSHTSAQDGKGRMWEGGYSYNRSADSGETYIPTGAKCIGSACMAWRWFDTVSDDGTQCQLKPTPHAARTPLPELSPLEHRRGSCGLAGRPE